MLSSITSNLASSIESRAQTLTTLVKLITPAGDTLAFTRYPTDIEYDGVIYRSTVGMELTAVEKMLGLGTDNLQAVGAYSDAVLSEADVLGGNLDGSEYFLYLIDYAHPEYGVKTIQRGWVRELRSLDYTFSVELASLSQLAQQAVGEITSPTCRNQFADKWCQGAEKRTDPTKNHPTLNRPMSDVGVTVASVLGPVKFTATLNAPDGFYTAGRITFTTGANRGLSMDVNTHKLSADGATAEFRLEEPFPAVVAVGDVFSIRMGCLKIFSACKKFDNVVNMRAEPYLTGARVGLNSQ